MADEIKRQLDELVARYEPELCCDIYVEGNTDKHLISCFGKSAERSSRNHRTLTTGISLFSPDKSKHYLIYAVAKW
jgi:hypothetical protein